MTNSIDDMMTAGCLLLVGSNTTEAHPIIGEKLRQAIRRGGLKLIVADPRKISLVKDATIWLRLKPGTDIALVNGLANIILQEGLWDKEFVESRTEGFEEWKARIADYTPEKVSEITGVPVADLYAAARLYATGGQGVGAERVDGKYPPSSITYCLGITEHICGTENVISLADLAMLTGNVGRPGSGVNPLRGQNNVQGACDMGCLPDVLPGYQKTINEDVRAAFAKAWFPGRSPKGDPAIWAAMLPSNRGLTEPEMLQGAIDGQIKAMFVWGENTVLSEANANHARHALESLEFLVVQDIFLTETAQLADVVLPAASFAEKDGTFTNTERRIQRVRKAIDPVGNSKPDWEIFMLLANRMGYKMQYENPSEIMEEIARLTPIYRGVSYSRLEKGGLQWPVKGATDPGTPILHTQQFTRGKGMFVAVDHVPPAEPPDEEYPLVLTTGRSLYHYHTGTMTRRSTGLEAIEPEELVEVNPADAERLEIKDGEMVRVTSRRGTVRAKAKVTGRSPVGVIWMTFHFHEAPVNVLTNSALDPISKVSELKVCAVRVEKDGVPANV
jgi:formate dehydrogenase alpha subunit